MSNLIRDNALLDALEKLDRRTFSGSVWRSVRQGRRPDECARSGGRWDDRNFDVLYTSLERQGAIEERRFHLFRGQPFPPSKPVYELYQLNVNLNSIIALETLGDLKEIGMSTEHYGQASYVERKGEYPRSQEIGEACFFLGADGLLVPNARHDSLNLILFCDQDPPPSISNSVYESTILGI